MASGLILACPSCGYDLSGLRAEPVLRCPECGHEARVSLLGPTNPPRMAREYARVVAVPMLVSGLCIVSWSLDEIILMYACMLGAGIASIIMGVVHAVDRPSGLPRHERRWLLVIGLVAHAQMLGLAWIVSSIAAERIANC